MAEVFISYTGQDQDAARSVAGALERSGLSVFDTTQITAGVSGHDELREELESASCVLVMWSKAAAQSEWMKQEIRWQFGHGPKIGSSSCGSMTPNYRRG
jgi:hypothetical protein